FNSISQPLNIKKPLVEAKLYINGTYERQYSSPTNTPITGEIRWANNLDTKINDLEIRAHITGNAVNRKTISGREGFYNSSTDEIIWDKNSIQEFREVN